MKTSLENIINEMINLDERLTKVEEISKLHSEQLNNLSNNNIFKDSKKNSELLDVLQRELKELKDKLCEHAIITL